jgi:membrane-associated phospholipid phosphatase
MAAVPRELLVVVLAVSIYFGVRGRTEGNVDRAVQNARWVVDVERALGINVEAQVQAWGRGSDAFVSLMNWIYIWGHWPVIVVTLLWLVVRHPATYVVTRNAMLLSGAFGMVVFALFPLAPPRLMDLGLLDTVTEYSSSYRVLQPPGFVNQYAAMPSLHMGWDLLIGMAIVGSAGSLLLRALGALLPVLMGWAVIATANHYVVDLVAGVVLVLVCHAVVSRRAALRTRDSEAVPSDRTS